VAKKSDSYNAADERRDVQEDAFRANA